MRRFAPSVLAMPASVYSALADRLAAHPGETYPLHIGDTWMEPAVGCRMEDLRVADLPGMHRYAPVEGLATLRDALAARASARMGAPLARPNVLVTAGATAGLAAAVGAIVHPGDEVLILAPHWPLIAGIVRSFHGVPVPVPWIGVVHTPADAAAALAARCTERTVAVYLSTPNNPTGRVLPADQVAAIVAFARERDLWVLADEAYEDFRYGAEAQPYAYPLAPERTVAAFTFSKALGMAGNRIGYLVGPPELITHACKVGTHTAYSTSTAAQHAVLRALTARAEAAVATSGGPGQAWIDHAVAQYAALGRDAAAVLGVPEPQGSTFLFLDVADQLDADGLPGFLERCVRAGLLVAPGPAFGPYPTHVRVCFTCAPPDRVRRGVRVLARLLGRSA
jgi:aspartate/methionine/tyrosine aminotransferase